MMGGLTVSRVVVLTEQLRRNSQQRTFAVDFQVVVETCRDHQDPRAGLRRLAAADCRAA